MTPMYALAAGIVRRIMNLLGSSQNALRAFLHFLTAVHLAVYRVTGGRVTGTKAMPSGGMILLTTTGRKSGQLRTVPLLSLRHDGDWLVTASNAGLERPPAWLFNLEANPAATVQAGRATVPVIATVADESARARLWPLFLRAYPGYADHEQRTSRAIPVVILTPAAPEPGAVTTERSGRSDRGTAGLESRAGRV